MSTSIQAVGHVDGFDKHQERRLQRRLKPIPWCLSATRTTSFRNPSYSTRFNEARSRDRAAPYNGFKRVCPFELLERRKGNGIYDGSRGSYKSSLEIERRDIVRRRTLDRDLPSSGRLLSISPLEPLGTLEKMHPGNQRGLIIRERGTNIRLGGRYRENPRITSVQVIIGPSVALILFVPPPEKIGSSDARVMSYNVPIDCQ